MNLQWRVGSQRQLGCDACDPLDLLDAVSHSVPSDVLVRGNPSFLAFTEIYPSDQFTKDDDIDALGNVGLKR